MNRSEKRLLRRTLQLGLALTLLIIAVDFLGVLDPLERYLHDFRARHFQYFTPPPTDQIVLLDIDDESLARIGWFPWRRTKLAEMTDEIKLAGAKVIGLDVVFAEPQDVRVEKESDAADTYRTIDDDANFAEALDRSGNVLIPVMLTLDEQARPAIFTAIVDLLRSNLELDAAGVSAKLRGTKFDTPGLAQQVRSLFLSAQDTAAFERVSAALDAGESDFEKIYAAIAPAAAAVNERGDLRQLLWKMLPRAQSVRRMAAEFSLPIPPNLPPLLRASTESATIPQLVAPARFSGAVNFPRERDGVIRSLPLFINYRGRLMPHMALSSTCAALGVRLQDLQLSPDSITIPVHDGAPIVVPVRTINSEAYGRVGMFIEVPWFGAYGPGSWLTMYDHPAHVEPRQHISLSAIWKIRELVADIQQNNRIADEALFALNGPYRSPARDAYLAKPFAQRDDAERGKIVAATITEMNDLGAMVESVKPSELSQDDAKFLASWRVLGRAAKSNQYLSGLMEKRRKDLHDQLGGRYALIGWTAAGTTDFYPTSLDPQCPGDAVQATVFNGILTRHLWTVSPWWVGALMTLIIGSATTLYVSTFRTIPALLLTVATMAGFLLINALLLFDWGNHIVGAAGALTAAFLIWFGVTVARYLYEQTERLRITKRFSSYADPALVEAVIQDPDAIRFDGQVREMTVVFTDLAGFTTISEKLQERTVPLLNEYMSLMLPIIRENHGFWNKFLGDGIMFFYNAPRENPKHAYDAVYTTLLMQKSVELFNQKLFTRGLPQVTMRAGIATGNMVVGDAGSVDPKHNASDYTVLGDEVNLGARLESANKALGSRIMLSDRTAKLAGDDILLRPLAKLVVVGKTQGIMTHEALCLRAEATDRHKLLAEGSSELVRRFIAREFDACIKAAQKLEEACGSSKFTQLYLRLSREYLIAPPGDGFDGTITLSDK